MLPFCLVALKRKKTIPCQLWIILSHHYAQQLDFSQTGQIFHDTFQAVKGIKELGISVNFFCL